MSQQETTTKKRTAATLNVYLILKREDQVLLSMRKNTGYYDGFYSLVAGHVEEDESASAAAIREAREEIGIVIFPEDLKVVHMMHRKTNRNNVDIFFECNSWSSEITNREPEKCAALEFHRFQTLPNNVVPYIEMALRASQNNFAYSEEGWNLEYVHKLMSMS